MSTRVELVPGPAPTRAAAGAVPDAVAPPPHNPRFPLVDGVRAIAALAILVTHTAGLSNFNGTNALGAWTARLDSGVAIFFVLSGFLLYRPWVAARLDGRPRPRVAAYARRRALRILPGYWLALTVLAVALPKEVPVVFSEHWWVYYGLLQSWSLNWILGGIGVAWSLSVEAAFYVLLPLLALAGARALRGRSHEQQVRWELWGLGLSAAAALVLRAVLEYAPGFDGFRNTLPGMWSWFAAGMALAVLSAAYGARPVGERPALMRSAAERPWLWWLGSLVALTVAAKATGLPRALNEPYTATTLQLEHVLYLLVAVGVVGPAVFSDGRRTGVSAILAHPVLAWLGLVSYGIFLYHLPLVTRFRGATTWVPALGYPFYVLVVFSVATALATVSYYAVERPLLRLKERRHPR